MAARLIARRCPTDLEKQASRNASDAPPRDDVAVLRATEQIALAVSSTDAGLSVMETAVVVKFGRQRSASTIN